jgi:hypothetical protein
MRLFAWSDSASTIVGVVRSVRQVGLAHQPRPDVHELAPAAATAADTWRARPMERGRHALGTLRRAPKSAWVRSCAQSPASDLGTIHGDAPTSAPPPPVASHRLASTPSTLRSVSTHTHSTTYAALRAVLHEHDAPATALTGLTELAALLSGRHGLAPNAAVKWMLGMNPALADQRPLDLWLGGGAARVIDAARAESTGAR